MTFPSDIIVLKKAKDTKVPRIADGHTSRRVVLKSSLRKDMLIKHAAHWPNKNEKTNTDNLVYTAVTINKIPSISFHYDGKIIHIHAAIVSNWS